MTVRTIALCAWLLLTSYSVLGACPDCGDTGVVEVRAWAKKGFVFYAGALAYASELNDREMESDPNYRNSINNDVSGYLGKKPAWAAIKLSDGTWGVGRLATQRAYCSCAAGQAMQRRAREEEERKERAAEEAREAEAQRMKEEQQQKVLSQTVFLVTMADGSTFTAKSKGESGDVYILIKDDGEILKVEKAKVSSVKTTTRGQLATGQAEVQKDVPGGPQRAPSVSAPSTEQAPKQNQSFAIGSVNALLALADEASALAAKGDLEPALARFEAARNAVSTLYWDSSLEDRGRLDKIRNSLVDKVAELKQLIKQEADERRKQTCILSADARMKEADEALSRKDFDLALGALDQAGPLLSEAIGLAFGRGKEELIARRESLGDLRAKAARLKLEDLEARRQERIRQEAEERRKREEHQRAIIAAAREAEAREAEKNRKPPEPSHTPTAAVPDATTSAKASGDLGWLAWTFWLAFWLVPALHLINGGWSDRKERVDHYAQRPGQFLPDKVGYSEVTDGQEYTPPNPRLGVAWLVLYPIVTAIIGLIPW